MTIIVTSFRRGLSLFNNKFLVIIIVLAYFAQITTIVRSESSVELGKSLIELTNSNFNEKINENDAILVMFRAEWCGHCKTAHVELKKAADSLNKIKKKSKLNFATLECTKDQMDKEICEKYNVKGFPTFVLFESGNPLPQANIDRESEKLVQFLLKYDGSPIKLLTGDQLVKLYQYNEKAPSAISYFTDPKSDEFIELEKAAKKLRSEITFGMTTDPSVLRKSKNDKEENNKNLLAMFRFGEDPVHYTGKWNEKDIQSFLIDESLPLVGTIDGETYEKYMQSGKHLVYFFHNTDEEKIKFMPVLKKLAQNNRETYKIGFINAVLYGTHGTQLGLEKKWPALAIVDTISQKKWFHDQKNDVTPESIEKFLQEFASGKLNHFLKSEPIVEQLPTEFVKNIVASNFEEIVLQPNKDVLVFFHATWCGYCKQLAPTYAVVAEKLAHLVDNIIIAKMDADKNDIPDSGKITISGFPTIALYHGLKKVPLIHEGGRNLEEIIEFLKKNAFHADKIQLKEEDLQSPGLVENNEEL